MYGTNKQIQWATDVVARVNSFSNRVSTIREVIEDSEANNEYKNKLIDITDKIFKRVQYINNEADAGAIINWYGYIGLEKVAGKRKYNESLEKFLGDILDDNEAKYIGELMKIDKMI